MIGYQDCALCKRPIGILELVEEWSNGLSFCSDCFDKDEEVDKVICAYNASIRKPEKEQELVHLRSSKKKQ